MQVILDHWPLKILVAGAGAAIDYIIGGGSGREFAVAVCLIIVLDVTTGIRASIHEGAPITSQRLGRLFDKLFGYFSLVIVAGVGSHVIGGKFATDVGAAAILAAIFCTEALSVVENARRLGARLPGNIEGILTGALGSTKEQ